MLCDLKGSPKQQRTETLAALLALLGREGNELHFDRELVCFSHALPTRQCIKDSIPLPIRQH